MHLDEENPEQPPTEIRDGLELPTLGLGDWAPPPRGIRLGATSREELERKVFGKNLNYYTQKRPDTDYSNFVLSQDDWQTLRSHQGDMAVPSFTDWGTGLQESEGLLATAVLNQEVARRDSTPLEHENSESGVGQDMQPSNSLRKVEQSMPSSLSDRLALELEAERAHGRNRPHSDPQMDTGIQLHLLHAAVVVTFFASVVGSFHESMTRLTSMYLTLSRSVLLFRLSNKSSASGSRRFAQLLQRRGYQMLVIDLSMITISFAISALNCIFNWIAGSLSQTCGCEGPLLAALVLSLSSTWYLGHQIRMREITLQQRMNSSSNEQIYKRIDGRGAGESKPGPQMTSISSNDREDMPLKAVLDVEHHSFGEKTLPEPGPGIQTQELLEQENSESEEELEDLEFVHLEETNED